MRQGSEEWHDWRKSGIGSSDAPVIMEVSPYSTPYRLWGERLGILERPDIGYAGWLGHNAEAVVRPLWEQMTGLIYEPAVFRNPELPWQTASTDGSEIDKASIIECKLNDFSKHGDALDGKVPDIHWPQVQHLLCATGAERCFYLSAPYKDNLEELQPGDIVSIEVLPDPEYIEELIKKEAAFIECLATETPPEMIDADFASIENPVFARAAGRWSKAKARFDKAKADLDQAKERLAKLADGRCVTGSGIKVNITTRRGSVAYAKVPELKGVNLDPYRGKGSVSVSVSAIKQKDDGHGRP